jgi:glycine cleavage system H protein
MSEVPGELNYTRDHEWIREAEDGSFVVGITDHAQSALGELVFVELPETDSEFEVGDGCAVVESVKAASDVFAPLSGTVVEVNERLANAPELVNRDPYGDGWLFRLKLAVEEDLEDLLSAADYNELLADSEE